MKSLIAFASVVALSVVPAYAAEGHVSNQALAKMGLSGMKAMADAQGAQIRGLSIAVAGGGSTATIHGVGGSASSTNFYLAAGKHSASGNNASVAGDSTTTSVSFGPFTASKTTTNVIGAGGFSSASAK
jgi:hypothetical protein